jgi:hypothetical protein
MTPTKTDPIEAIEFSGTVSIMMFMPARSREAMRCQIP